MPVTAGQGNPKWTREESLLALELYFLSDGPIDRKNNAVIELSELLRCVGETRFGKISTSFRNADGVALKLQNLHAAITKNEKGLSSSIGDRAVVEDFPFPKARNEVLQAAESIRIAFALASNITSSLEDDEEFVFKEGKTVTRIHMTRERSPDIRKKLLANRRETDGKLKCEVCDIVSPSLEPSLFDSMFEAHHIIPLSASKGSKTTRLADMSLLCACCHRFLHRMISSKKRWVGIDEARRARSAEY